MSCELPGVVAEYLAMIEADTPRACPEVHAFAELIRRTFETEDLLVYTDRLEHYLRLERYFPFKLFPWQKALIALWLCTYSAPGRPRWRTLFILLGRGGGKDGFIAFSAFCLVSPYNPVPRYDVDICALNQEQAMRPLEDIVAVLEMPKLEQKLSRFYYHTKVAVRGKKNGGTIKGRTNNPAGRNGMRSGLVVFNEVHTYKDYASIKVFRSGLGKVDEPRTAIITSQGDVSNGPLDDYIDRSRRILLQGEPDEGFLSFVNILPDLKLMDDPENWSMANPSLPYLPTLKMEMQDEYADYKSNPEENGDLVTKRMGIRRALNDLVVTEYENIKRTKAPLPDLTGHRCVVSLDYAELRDMASVNLHFRDGDQRFDINHSWLCLQSPDLPRLHIPWQQWAAAEHLTLVDDVSIRPEMLTEYIADMGKRYQILGLALDNYRLSMMTDPLRRIGFDPADKEKVKLIRPSDIMRIDPVIQDCFTRGLYAWGDNPVLRWGTNNTKRVRSSRTSGSDTGNFYYAKIEARSRKTDPFMALVAGMCIEDKLTQREPVALPPVGAIVI